MSWLETGYQSFEDGFREFGATVLGSGPTGFTNVTCGVEGHLQTRFYLDPWAEGDCAGTDWIVIACQALVLHVISWSTRWVLWEPFFTWHMKGEKKWSTAECKRFSQTCSSLLLFIISGFSAWRVLTSKGWFFDRPQWSLQGPVVDADFKFFYIFYSARFVSDSISIFFEDRKWDAFVVAFIHHVVTILLIVGSANSELTRMGCTVMFYFDWADIPLLTAKIFKYLSKDPNDSFQWTANRCFEVFALTFFATRNCIFNYMWYVYYSDLTHTTSIRILLVLLVVLGGLQTYWLYLVIMAVIRQKENGGKIEDVREDDSSKKKD